MPLTIGKTQSFFPVKNPGLYIVELSKFSNISLDPATNFEKEGSGINSMICETLYDYDGDLLTELKPALAESYPVWSNDGKKFNITLKQGIRFHDGVEFNAWVYKYSLDRVLLISDPNSAAHLLSSFKGAKIALGYGDMNSTEAKDYLSASAIKVLSDYVIEFNLDYAYVPIIPAITYQVGCAVSPKSVIDNIPSTFMANETDNETGMISLQTWFPELAGNYTKLGLNDSYNPNISGVIPSGVVKEGTPAQHMWFQNHQVGTGPWMLTLKTDTVIELDRNEN
jgi:ABC-type transport system substrate-binding protein